jgi:ribosomal protein S18 acetylase RimI-like enzyme
MRPRWAGTSVLLRRELGDPLPNVTGPSDVRFEWADSSRIERIAAQPRTRSGEAVCRSFAAGHRCLCAIRADEVVGYGWISAGSAYSSFGEAAEIKVMSLGPGEAFGYDVHILPRSRRSGIGLALLTTQLQSLRDEGFARWWAAVDVTNRPSLRLFRGLFCRPSHLAYSFLLGPWRRTFLGSPRDGRLLNAWFDAV